MHKRTQHGLVSLIGIDCSGSLWLLSFVSRNNRVTFCSHKSRRPAGLSGPPLIWWAPETLENCRSIIVLVNKWGQTETNGSSIRILHLCLSLFLHFRQMVGIWRRATCPWSWIQRTCRWTSSASDSHMMRTNGNSLGTGWSSVRHNSD